MVQIKFIRQGANSLFGSFSSGDLARVSESFAAHLVNEAGVAEYLQPGRSGVHAASEAPAQPEAVPARRQRKAK
jgi:hypothetical protein